MKEEVDVLGYPSLTVPMETIIHGRKATFEEEEEDNPSWVKEEVDVGGEVLLNVLRYQLTY